MSPASIPHWLGLDGDTADSEPRHLLGLLGPLLSDRSVELVKGAFDRPLRAGEVILSGSLGPMAPVAPGDVFVADISGLGQVSATFTERTR